MGETHFLFFIQEQWTKKYRKRFSDALCKKGMKYRTRRSKEIGILQNSTEYFAFIFYIFQNCEGSEFEMKPLSGS